MQNVANKDCTLAVRIELQNQMCTEIRKTSTVTPALGRIRALRIKPQAELRSARFHAVGYRRGAG